LVSGAIAVAHSGGAARIEMRPAQSPPPTCAGRSATPTAAATRSGAPRQLQRCHGRLRFRPPRPPERRPQRPPRLAPEPWSRSSRSCHGLRCPARRERPNPPPAPGLRVRRPHARAGRPGPRASGRPRCLAPRLASYRPYLQGCTVASAMAPGGGSGSLPGRVVPLLPGSLVSVGQTFGDCSPADQNGSQAARREVGAQSQGVEPAKPQQAPGADASGRSRQESVHEALRATLAQTASRPSSSKRPRLGGRRSVSGSTPATRGGSSCATPFSPGHRPG
jgi:hypothetical protein